MNCFLVVYFERDSVALRLHIPLNGLKVCAEIV